MRFFCTYFDQRYLPRGLALFHSLQQHSEGFELWVLCMDSLCFETLSRMALPGLIPVSLEDFEKEDSELLSAKSSRSLVEYYFTCTPSLPLFVLRNQPKADTITYLDADLFFFDSPEIVFEEIGSKSIGIIPHRFPPRLSHLAESGIYNVGWLTFRRDKDGMACLQWWRERCIEWCYDICEPDRFADQKYLDRWPRLFNNLIVLQQKGANLAPWNIANYSLQIKQDKIMIDGDPLVFYHFHGLKRISRRFYNANLLKYESRLSLGASQRIYKPYIQVLHQVYQELPSELRESLGLKRAANNSLANGEKKWPAGLQHLRKAFWNSVETGKGILANQYIYFPD